MGLHHYINFILIQTLWLSSLIWMKIFIQNYYNGLLTGWFHFKTNHFIQTVNSFKRFIIVLISQTIRTQSNRCIRVYLCSFTESLFTFCHMYFQPKFSILLCESMFYSLQMIVIVLPQFDTYHTYYLNRKCHQNGYMQSKTTFQRIKNEWLWLCEKIL